MRLALAQMNTVVGDLDGNRERIVARLEEAREAGADLVLFPELATTGYPPEDLLLRPGFLRAAAKTLDAVAAETKDIAALVGAPHLDRDLFNACAVCADGEVKAMYRKQFLPNYGVFDEDRYFQPGRELVLLRCGETLVGPTVCEDIWQPGPPATDLALAGAHIVANISASPFHLGKGAEREEMLATRARDNSCWIAFVNAVGAQDELIFDGHSLVLDEEGRIVARAPSFEEALLIVDVDSTTAVGRRLRDARRRALARARREMPNPPVIDIPDRESRGELPKPVVAPPLHELEQMRLALELGLRDYVQKNDFREVVLGVSGGIDSALTAALAAEALGPEHVVCVSMPSRYSSEETQADARRLAETLGARYIEIPRPPRDGSVEQVRLASPGDREQERTVGRLRDPLRRYGGRVRPSEGRLQDGRLSPGPISERKSGPRADPAERDRARSERRAPRRPAGRGFASALPRARPRARGVRRAGRVARGTNDERVRRRRRRPCGRDDRPRRVQASPGAARREAAPEGVRPRPAGADHQSLARLKRPGPPLASSRFQPRAEIRVSGARKAKRNVTALC